MDRIREFLLQKSFIVCVLVVFSLFSLGCVSGSRQYQYPLVVSIWEQVRELNESEVRQLLGTPYYVDTKLGSNVRHLCYERSISRGLSAGYWQEFRNEKDSKRFSYERRPKGTPNAYSNDMAICSFTVVISAQDTVSKVYGYEKREGDCEFLGELPMRVEQVK